MDTTDLSSYYSGYDEYCEIKDEYQYKLESKVLLYENFTKLIEELIEDSETQTVKIDDIKLQLNDLRGELRSV